MSCITKLLELKGDKKFFACHSQAGIEGGGIYKGYEYLISFTSLGHRCGYVAIPDGIAGNYDDIDCHGGVTFEGSDHGFKDLLDTRCSDLWIGFDAAHAGDIGDLDLAVDYFDNSRCILLLKETMDQHLKELKRLGQVHRTFEYMEKECHHIIDQLIEKAA